MQDWGAAAADFGCYYHVARVNTARRFHLAHAAGAWSVDGSSASRYAVTVPRLDLASRQPDFFSPRSSVRA
jgi:hypothetical protein